MTFKDILLKINTFPSDRQADARRAVLQGKMSGLAPDAVWDSIKDFGQDLGQKTEKKTTKQNTVKASALDRVGSPEVVQGETVDNDDYVNGLYLPDIYDKINQCIKDFCIRYDIDYIQGLKKSRQPTWAALCKYIGSNVFKKTNILKSNDMSFTGCTTSNCNRYDINKVAAILSYCEFLSDLLDKTFTWWSASDFIGADSRFIADHEEELTRAGFDSRKKTENSINNIILDGRTNPTGAIATLNYRFKWAQPSQASAPASVNVSVYPVLSASDAPALPDRDKM